MDIVASGTVTSFNGNPIEIVFDALGAPLELARMGLQARSSQW
jgi:hypothetical protein